MLPKLVRKSTIVKPATGFRMPFPRRVGQVYTDITGEGAGDIARNPPRRGNGSCDPVKYIGGIEVIDAGATATVEVTSPGAFCPSQILLNSGSGLESIFVTGITSGLENQIISGEVSGLAWAVEGNRCCFSACLKCLCMPGVPMRMTMRNSDGQNPATVEWLVVGSYSDVCPPNGVAGMNPPRPAGCPEHDEKLIGQTVTLAAGETRDIVFNTPGKFCPRRWGITPTAGVVIESINNGLHQEIIQGPVSAEFFEFGDVDCCPGACLECICMPGVNLVYRVTNQNEGSATFNISLVGSYQDAC